MKTVTQKRKNLVQSVNPLLLNGAHQDATGDLMPSGIHGGIAMENSDTTIFKSNIPQREIDYLLQTSNIENSRFDIGQFTKYYDQDNIEWCALFSESHECLSIAAIQSNHPYNGYIYIDEIQTLKKGFGLPLLKEIVERYKKVWLMANTSSGDSLIDYYRNTGLFEEIAIEDSVYGCPAYFFCTSQCDYVKLEDYCFAFYANDNGDEDGDEFVDESTISKESSIDYPVSEGLCPDIWNEVEEGKFMIKPQIKQKAWEMVSKLLAHYHVEATGVNIVGSICSNQYTPDADVDVHIQVDLPDDVAEKLNNLRKKETDKIFAGIDLMVGEPGKTHPLEFYFQSNIYGDMGSCGCYDLLHDEWLSGPQIVDIEFDPFEEYSSSWDEAVEFGHKVQEALFDLHKNMYKYNAMIEHASNREIYSDEQMMKIIAHRIMDVQDEISSNAQKIYELREEMVKVRKRAGIVPRNEEEAEDMRTNKEWLTANSTFKFLQRMNVLDSVWEIADLYQKYNMDENELTINLNRIMR